ncbi:hypothetical protein R6G99_01375, partial [Actinotignum timonense]|nr:hypothetical protein [Actinotignum timonense]
GGHIFVIEEFHHLGLDSLGARHRRETSAHDTGAAERIGFPREDRGSLRGADGEFRTCES